ncbi:MAG: hypothetical protein KBG28_27155 [Kofleriaceae bacterium]|nr:hypothetical protein [Kofleriaceae bacterium]MBP6839172.1 hypothetical protein [Kofleriaceae bacterium]MBP9207673.1 hypothetical protein [Kofleriaceae bacterium]
MKEILSYVLAVVGLVVVFVGVARAWAMSLSYAPTHLNLVNQLRTNPRAAHHMCGLSTGSFLEGVGAAMKTAATLGLRDGAMIAQATRPTYDAQAQAVTMAWKGLFDKAKLGGGAALAGLALTLTGKSKGGPPIPLVVIAVVVVGGLGYILWRKAEAERQIVLARAQILPEVDRVFVDGRY